MFVFPSLTDTFGIVQLEALASGVPVAAFPVTGPKDVVADHPIGVLNEDLRTACLEALQISREACRAFALNYSWENSARQFIGHARKVAAGNYRRAAARRRRSQKPPAAKSSQAVALQHEGSSMSDAFANRPRHADVTKAYARWAPVYDLVFGAVFERGRHAAIAAAERVGGRILEVGVGTGISLPEYTRDCSRFAASIFPSRCCARRRSASPNSA